MSNRRQALWWLLSAWLPAILGIVVIACESTDTFSSANTSEPLRHLWEMMAGPVSNAAWETIHRNIRKTGHVIGYGMLSGLFFRAWFLTFREFLGRRVQEWQTSSLLALVCTLAVGSSDELHQKLLPSRTSSPLDVVVDMAGAFMVQLLIAMYFLFARGRQQALVAADRNPDY
jgi:VanZ family protein